MEKGSFNAWKRKREMLMILPKTLDSGRTNDALSRGTLCIDNGVLLWQLHITTEVDYK